MEIRWSSQTASTQTVISSYINFLRHLSHHNRKLLLIAKIELTVYHIMVARFHLRTGAKNALVGQCFNNQIYYLSYHTCYVPISNKGGAAFLKLIQILKFWKFEKFEKFEILKIIFSMMKNYFSSGFSFYCLGIFFRNPKHVFRAPMIPSERCYSA